MIFDFIEKLANYIEDRYGVGYTPYIELCPNNSGDFTINCFKLAPILKSKPEKIAQQLSDFIKGCEEIEDVDCVKAFINISVKPYHLHTNVIEDIDKNIFDKLILNKENRNKYLIEYSAPNTNKPLHLGHVRNNVLGMSLVSLLRRLGNEVIAVNLINDRGIHISKTMVAYKRFGNGATPESAGKKGDHFVGDFYVLFEKELKRQVEELKRKDPEKYKDKSGEELFSETEIGKEAQEVLQKWESGDPEVIELWKKMNKWVIEGFNETYKRMGVTFDKVYFESDTYKLGKDIIEYGLRKGVFKRREDGAIIAPLKEKYNLNDKVVLRADGTSVYITQDIGTSIMKYEDFHPYYQVWVVGDEQIYHFKVLFAILKELGYEWSDRLYHLAYGMINLPSGRMKSREGTVVDADNLFDEMADLARKATLARCGENIPDDLDSRSEIIAQGAIKFMLLKFNAKTTITFDPKASIKFEGDTGPYVQYVCARINSILKKANKYGITLDDLKSINWNLLNSRLEKRVTDQIYFYPKVLRNAAEKYDVSGIVLYLLNLAKSFNAFYKECSVLNAETEELKRARLALCLAVRKVIGDGLKTLMIDIPEAM